jgi:FlaA1/EpsC-like NDP-sugar epimerase
MPAVSPLSPAVWILFGLCAIAFVVGVRIAPRALLDLVSFANRKSSAANTPSSGAVVYGAGQRGMLYTDLMHLNALRSRKPAPVIGFIDDDRALRGRMVRSFHVLGGMRDLANLLKSGALREVILTAPLSDKRLARLRRLCRQNGVALFEWKPQLRCLVAPASTYEGTRTPFDDRDFPSPSDVANDS